MKLTLILVLLCNLSFGQSVLKKMAPKACDCFNNEINMNQEDSVIVDDFRKTCIDKINAEFMDEIMLLADTSSWKPIKQQAYELGRKMSHDMRIELIKNCDSFYSFYEPYYSQRDKININEAKQKIQELTNSINSNEVKVYYYFERSMQYFFIDELDMALSDVNNVIELNPNFAPAYLLKGRVLILQYDYENAHAVLEKAMEISDNPNAEIYHAFTIRYLKE